VFLCKPILGRDNVLNHFLTPSDSPIGRTSDAQVRPKRVIGCAVSPIGDTGGAGTGINNVLSGALLQSVQHLLYFIFFRSFHKKRMNGTEKILGIERFRTQYLSA
jgi:hypothetical protein